MSNLVAGSLDVTTGSRSSCQQSVSNLASRALTSHRCARLRQYCSAALPWWPAGRRVGEWADRAGFTRQRSQGRRKPGRRVPAARRKVKESVLRIGEGFLRTRSSSHRSGTSAELLTSLAPRRLTAQLTAALASVRIGQAGHQSPLQLSHGILPAWQSGSGWSAPRRGSRMDRRQLRTITRWRSRRRRPYGWRPRSTSSPCRSDTRPCVRAHRAADRADAAAPRDGNRSGVPAIWISRGRWCLGVEALPDGQARSSGSRHARVQGEAMRAWPPCPGTRPPPGLRMVAACWFRSTIATGSSPSRRCGDARPASCCDRRRSR